MTDPEKWLNVIGEEKPTVDDDCSMTIKLKTIAPDELGQNQIKFIPKKSRKSAYFVRDRNTILSDEDVRYQMVNVSETTQKKVLLPEIIRKDLKLRESIDKLFKSPHRCLSPVLISYYTRNLKYSKENVNDFQICYEEIQEDVERIMKLRKKLKNDIYIEMPTSKNHRVTRPIFYNKNEPDNEDNQNQEISPDKKIVNQPLSSTTISKATLLKQLDTDFKPKMILGTKTYTRKKLKPE